MTLSDDIMLVHVNNSESDFVFQASRNDVISDLNKTPETPSNSKWEGVHYLFTRCQ